MVTLRRYEHVNGNDVSILAISIDSVHFYDKSNLQTDLHPALSVCFLRLDLRFREGTLSR